MFYRLWGAANRRPKRALWIAATVLAVGSMAHLFVSIQVFMLVSGKSMSERSITPGELASELAKAQSNVNIALVADLPSLFLAVILGSWALERTIRRKP